jgi:hypothetical protein
MAAAAEQSRVRFGHQAHDEPNRIHGQQVDQIPDALLTPRVQFLSITQSPIMHPVRLPEVPVR